ncbi:MAG: response regulator transcription factor [Ktedonobacterales bacterium]
MAAYENTAFPAENTSFSADHAVHPDLKRRIFIADDDDQVRRMLVEYLEGEGYLVEQAADGRQALAAIADFLPDLVVLDVRMPEVDGLEIVRRVHARSNVPIIILSGLTEDIDRIAGLSAGSDDYVTKPVRPRELLLRIQALLRRAAATEAAPPVLEGDLRFDDLIIRPRLHVVERNGVSIELSANEFDLLYFLASQPRQVFTRQQLLDRVWHYDYLGDSNTVTVHMSRLRKKVEVDPAHPRHLRTVWNIGYKFEP